MRLLTKKTRREVGCIPQYSVAIVGPGSVGKTCLIERLMYNGYSLQHIPTISEVYHVNYEKNFKTVAKLLLYDTAGSIDFPVMRRLVISKSQACITVYSVDSLKSFKLVRYYLDEIKQMTGKNFPCVLVGSKRDVEKREVSFEVGLQCAVEYGCSYVECSAINGVNINDSIESVLSRIEALKMMPQKKVKR